MSPVELVVSDEHEQLRDSVRRLLADKAPPRSSADGDHHDAGVWAQLADMGLQALIVPEAYGGLGQSSVEAAIVYEEMGRALYDGPYLASVAMATNALLLAGDDGACADLLPAMAAGERNATVVGLVAPVRGGETAPTPLTARSGAGGIWVLDGAAPIVVDVMAADLLLVFAGTEAGPGLFAVEANDGGVRRSALDGLDPTRYLGSLDLAGAAGRAIGPVGQATELAAALGDRLAAAVAAESAGGMRACLDLSVDHAKHRTQFGVAIGSFQAIAHRCVEMLQRAEFTAAAAQYAAAAAAQGSEEASIAARVAAAYAGPAYRWVTTETIQVHGGLGFTWEHDAHLYYRRSRSVEHLFASPDERFEAVASAVGL